MNFLISRRFLIKVSLFLFRERNGVNNFKGFLRCILCLHVNVFNRNNFKAAQPMLKEELGITTLQLGYIGLAFSITYGLGKSLIGYMIDGRNTKRIISFLLIMSSIIVLIMGFTLSYFGSAIGFLIVLWGLNGMFQSVGGPASYSTISRWAPRTKRGRYLGFWNASHNIGGAIAGSCIMGCEHVLPR